MLPRPSTRSLLPLGRIKSYKYVKSQRQMKDRIKQVEELHQIHQGTRAMQQHKRSRILAATPRLQLLFPRIKKCLSSASIASSRRLVTTYSWQWLQLKTSLLFVGILASHKSTTSIDTELETGVSQVNRHCAKMSTNRASKEITIQNESQGTKVGTYEPFGWQRNNSYCISCSRSGHAQ